LITLLDTYRSVETPEGVELGLRVAGPPVRCLAWAIDLSIRTGGYLGLLVVVAFLGEVGMGLFLLALFLGEWFYPVYFEVRRDGATPGKRRMGIRVVHDDGTPVTLGSSLLRNLVRFADFLPLAYGFGFVSMLFSPDFKRLGDHAAGTVVVHGEAETGGTAGVPEAPALPPPVTLSPEEQRVVVDFAQRLPGWMDGRAQELADHAWPLTGASGPEGVEKLVAMANWLLGRR